MTCFDVFMEGVEQLFWRLDVVGVARRYDYYLPCAIEIVSKVLGYCVVAGSLGYKLPQISTVYKSQSAHGLSAAAFELDVIVFTASLGYSVRSRLPLSEYGEQGIVLAQNLVLVVLVWHFNGTQSSRRFFCVLAEIVATIAIVSLLSRQCEPAFCAGLDAGVAPLCLAKRCTFGRVRVENTANFDESPAATHRPTCHVDFYTECGGEPRQNSHHPRWLDGPLHALQLFLFLFSQFCRPRANYSLPTKHNLSVTERKVGWSLESFR